MLVFVFCFFNSSLKLFRSPVTTFFFFSVFFTREIKSLFQTDFNTDDCNVTYKQRSLCMSYYHQRNKVIMKTETDINVI